MKYIFNKDFSAQVGSGGIVGFATKSYKKGDVVEGELSGSIVKIRLTTAQASQLMGAQEFLEVPISDLDVFVEASLVSETKFAKYKTVYIVIGILVVITISMTLYFKFKK